MKSRKNFAKTISIATTLITLAFFAFGCGDAKTTADTPEETEKATEIVSQEETEKPEPATEVVAEEETEATEQEVETEEPVLFRICLKAMGDTTGAWVTDQPGEEFNDMFLVEAGNCFDVYEVVEKTNGTFYRIKLEDGSTGYVYSNDVDVIE